MEVQNKIHTWRSSWKNQLLFIWKNTKISQIYQLPTSTVAGGNIFFSTQESTWKTYNETLTTARTEEIFLKAGFGRVNGGRWWKTLDVFVPWFTIEMEVSMGKSSINDGSMGKSSINDGFSSKPCLMTPEGYFWFTVEDDWVLDHAKLSSCSCSSQLGSWFPHAISRCKAFGKSEQILSFKLWLARSDDQSLGRLFSAGSDEHIGAYRVLFGCLWVRAPNFRVEKMGLRCCSPMGILRWIWSRVKPKETGNKGHLKK